MAEKQAEKLAADLNKLAANEFDDALKVLVLGGAGNGKSSLILNNLSANEPNKPNVGDDCDGITKRIDIYKGRPLRSGKSVIWVDSPGLGDADCKPAAVIAAYEMAFNPELLKGIDAVVATVNLGAGARRDLAVQLAEIIIRKGFDSTRNVILCGTRSDLAKASVKDSFGNKLKRQFFENCGNRGADGFVSVVSQADYSQLYDALGSLPASKIKYTPPPAAQLGKAIAETIGADPQLTVAQLHDQRLRNEASIKAWREKVRTSSNLATNSLLGVFCGETAGRAAEWGAQQYVGKNLAQAMEQVGFQAIKASTRYGARTTVEEVGKLGARALSKKGGEYVVVGATSKAVVNTAGASAAVEGACSGAAGLVPGLVGMGMEVAVKTATGSVEAAKSCGFLAQTGTGAAMGAVGGPIGAATGAGIAAAMWVGSQLLSSFVIAPVMEKLA